MRIHVRFNDKAAVLANIHQPNHVVIEMAQSATVKDLRHQIHKEYNVDYDMCSLLANGHSLRDKIEGGNQALLYNDYKLKAGVNTVEVTYRSWAKREGDNKENAVVGEGVKDKPDAISDDDAAVFAGEVTNVEEMGVRRTVGAEEFPAEQSGYLLGAVPEDEPEPPRDEIYDACKRCKEAKDNRQPCKDCGCNVCGSKRHEDKILLCDGYASANGTACPHSSHIFCATPELTSLPGEHEQWLCDKCYEDTEVESRGVTTESHEKSRGKKASKAKSASTSKSWGGGHSTSGHDKLAHVDVNARGQLPGIRVGQLFYNRNTCANWGVHTQQMAGIMCGYGLGCMAICVSGGYDDDADQGDILMYTGEGGKDLSDNKRTTKGQQKHQNFVRGNMAMAMAIHPKGKGGKTEAGHDAGAKWEKGLEVRVIRGYDKKRRGPHDPTKIEPEYGYRYDGVYKIVRYWPKERVEDKNMVYQFEFRRVDPSPAPWTEEGKKAMKDMRMLFPDEPTMKKYYEEKKNGPPPKPKVVKGGKRKATNSSPTAAKKARKASPTPSTKSADAYVFNMAELSALPFPQVHLDLIAQAPATQTEKWEDVFTAATKAGGGLPMLIKAIDEVYVCPLCDTSVALETNKPMLLPCSHLMCTDCWARSGRSITIRLRKQKAIGVAAEELDGLRRVGCPLCREYLCDIGEHKNQPIDEELFAHVNSVIHA